MTTPRDIESVNLSGMSGVWAADRSDNIEPDDAVALSPGPALVRRSGWPESFSATDGPGPRREVFNQIFREITGMLVELNQHGLLEWDERFNYMHPAAVLHNGNVYLSSQDSSNQNPASSTGFWRIVTEFATAAEAREGSDNTKLMTPMRVRESLYVSPILGDYAELDDTNHPAYTLDSNRNYLVCNLHLSGGQGSIFARASLETFAANRWGVSDIPGLAFEDIPATTHSGVHFLLRGLVDLWIPSSEVGSGPIYLHTNGVINGVASGGRKIGVNLFGHSLEAGQAPGTLRRQCYVDLITPYVFP